MLLRSRAGIGHPVRPFVRWATMRNKARGLQLEGGVTSTKIAVLVPLVFAVTWGSALAPGSAASSASSGVAPPQAIGGTARPKACSSSPIHRFTTSAGVIEANLPPTATEVSGTPTTMERDTKLLVSGYWLTFATAKAYTHGPVVVLQSGNDGAPCIAALAIEAIRPGAQGRLASRLTRQLNYRFVRIDGADVSSGTPAAGSLHTDVQSVGLTGSELVAVMAFDTTTAASSAFVSSVSTSGLAAGALVATTASSADRSGTITGTVLACVAEVSAHATFPITVWVERGRTVVNSQIVVDTLKLNQPFAFYVPAGRYKLQATPANSAVTTVQLHPRQTVTVHIGHVCI